MRSSFVCPLFYLQCNGYYLEEEPIFMNTYCELVFASYHLNGQTNEIRIEETVISAHTI
jgi:hypothetical protein